MTGGDKAKRNVEGNITFGLLAIAGTSDSVTGMFLVSK